MRISQKQRTILATKYDGKCAYCGDPLPDRWHADHIEAVRRIRRYNPDKCRWEFDGTYEHPENNKLDNFNPSCPQCNINKHQMSIEQFRRSIAAYIDSLNKYSVQYQMASKYNLVQETKASVVFYFETYEQRIDYCACEFVVVEMVGYKYRCHYCKKPVKEN